METKDTLSSCSNSEERQMQQIQDKAKKSCMVSFRKLHSHLKLLSHDKLKETRTESGFKRAFATLFGQDVETFIGTIKHITALKEQDTSSRSGNDANADDAYIRPIYDEEPMAENVEQCHDTCPLPATLTDNQTTELSNQSLESENIRLKKTVAQISKSKFKRRATCSKLRIHDHSNEPSSSKLVPKVVPPFEMSMMGELKFFLGIQIYQSPRGIFINQAKYAQETLKKYGMTSCDSIGTPMATKHLDADLSGTPVDKTKYLSMVGALMYLTTSRPDIVHATCYCARYQAKLTEKHLTAVKQIFRYLKDTINMGLWYPKDTGFELTAFSDSDHAGYLDSSKSTSGGIQFLGGDKLVSWSSKNQDCTSMSLAEVEYVSLSACCAQVLWLRTQLTDYGFHFDKIPMYCDSKAAIAISCNPVQHSRTKHIDLADLFTKALSEDKFRYLGMRCLTPEQLEVLENKSA
ncbi:retrovirus-related pol polyprotein from transposon TNT 1-94 [Tanacetum coccineum]